ncbi:hypothetical protein Tco_0151460 [Tanacetum coccineum]
MVAYLKKPTGSEGFQEIVDFLNGGHIMYAFTKNPTIYVSLIKKIWQTATVRTVNNGEQEINATVDGKEFTITEASVRRHLQLADADGISVLPNTKFFDQLTLMGYVLTNDKLTFLKEPIPHIESSSPQKTQSPRQALNKDTELPQTSVPIPYDSSNIAKTQSTATPTELISQETGLDDGPKRQETIGGASIQTRFERASKLSYDSPLGGGNTPRSDEDSMTLQELTALCTKLSDMVLDLETDIRKIKKVYAKVLSDAARVHTYSRRRRTVSTGSGGVSTASRIVSTAGMIQQVNIIIPSSSATKDKGKAIMRESEPKQTTTKLKQRQERAGYEAAIRLQE